eukprot:snap_masked-scaffold14_size734282-processed-gene-6.3 protein:Tk11309 transcript:snap_masked-scaffold14_size734282-processed-gene-6.3-mRNA-1 annotation:"hypothetical protein DAPPUDRAFT_8442"
MSAPDSFPAWLNQIRMNLPNREELSFRTVLALPQASSTGLVWTILSSKEASPSFLFPEAPTQAKCPICKSTEPHFLHYGGISCYSCRAFFRRAHQKTRTPQFTCLSGGSCEINVLTRKDCRKCRYDLCLKVGMRPQLVLDGSQKRRRFHGMILNRSLGSHEGQGIQSSSGEGSPDLRMEVPTEDGDKAEMIQEIVQEFSSTLSEMDLAFDFVQEMAEFHQREATRLNRDHFKAYFNTIGSHFQQFARNNEYFKTFPVDIQGYILAKNTGLFQAYILVRYFGSASGNEQLSWIFGTHCPMNYSPQPYFYRSMDQLMVALGIPSTSSLPEADQRRIEVISAMGLSPERLGIVAHLILFHLDLNLDTFPGQFSLRKAFKLSVELLKYNQNSLEEDQVFNFIKDLIQLRSRFEIPTAQATLIQVAFDFELWQVISIIEGGILFFAQVSFRLGEIQIGGHKLGSLILPLDQHPLGCLEDPLGVFQLGGEGMGLGMNGRVGLLVLLVRVIVLHFRDHQVDGLTLIRELARLRRGFGAQGLFQINVQRALQIPARSEHTFVTEGLKPTTDYIKIQRPSRSLMSYLGNLGTSWAGLVNLLFELLVSCEKCGRLAMDGLLELSCESESNWLHFSLGGCPWDVAALGLVGAPGCPPERAEDHITARQIGRGSGDESDEAQFVEQKVLLGGGEAQEQEGEILEDVQPQSDLS